MHTYQVTFEEVGRVRVGDSTEVVLSRVVRGKEFRGYSVTKFVTTPEFTGWAKGTFIPEDYITDFLKLFPKKELEYALEDLK